RDVMDSCFLVRRDGLGLGRPVPSGAGNLPTPAPVRPGGASAPATRSQTVRMRASHWSTKRRSRRRAARTRPAMRLGELGAEAPGEAHNGPRPSVGGTPLGPTIVYRRQDTSVRQVS